MTDQIKKWSETRTASPVALPENLATKNVRTLNPLAAPDLYYELYDNAAVKVKITDPKTIDVQRYELKSNINNPNSSAHFKVLKSPETGHHILIAKGMDLPGRDEGAGKSGFIEDLKQQDSAEDNGCITDQILDAEQAYLNLLQNPEVKSIEVIGYSIGSIQANYLASVYGAKVTNIADLGVPGTGWDSGYQKFMAENFNTCAHGLFPGAYGNFADNLNKNVVGLELRMDTMGGAVGGVGTRFGKTIVLDEKDINLMGIGHVPLVYAETARAQHNAPITEPVAISPEKQFKPF
ncbi:MAG TPA: hypothetical protein DEA55_05890 [Rhodospirillaceae bacterium]|nr:hypothetical protein [Rhodospirillaceae bacterium]